MKPVVLSRLAETDIDGIWDFIASDNPQAADRVLDAIEDALVRLSRNPGIGHFREDLADRRHRFFAVLSYLIIFRIEAEALNVVRVLHGSRDVHALLGADLGNSS